MKYTALELLKLAGVEKPAQKIKTFGVHIGGVVVNSPDHLIETQEATEIGIIVGKESYDATLEGKRGITDAAREVLDKNGREKTKEREAREKEKNKT